MPGGFVQTNDWDTLAFPNTKLTYGIAPSSASLLNPTMTPTVKAAQSTTIYNTNSDSELLSAMVALLVILILISLAALSFSCYKHWNKGHILPIQSQDNELDSVPKPKARKVLNRNVSALTE